VAAWLERLNPEVVLVMFGTNDLSDLAVDAYRDRLRSVVRRCLDRGTVVILSTIPPRHGFAGKAAEFAAAARTIAGELSVPLVDYHAEVLKRRPNDWDGATDDFKGFDGYDVPTLLARDGVHPSAPRLYEDDYSEKALRNHGYGLRNYVVLMKYAEVVGALTAPRPAAGQKKRPQVCTFSLFSCFGHFCQPYCRQKVGARIDLQCSSSTVYFDLAQTVLRIVSSSDHTS
jgi:GDSL-like Lipase/Acylhydrolase family